MVIPDDYTLPTQTTPGEAEKREAKAILDLIRIANFKFLDESNFELLIQLLVSNGTLTLEQVKRILGEG